MLLFPEATEMHTDCTKAKSTTAMIPRKATSSSQIAAVNSTLQKVVTSGCISLDIRRHSVGIVVNAARLQHPVKIRRETSIDIHADEFGILVRMPLPAICTPTHVSIRKISCGGQVASLLCLNPIIILSGECIPNMSIHAYLLAYRLGCK